MDYLTISVTLQFLSEFELQLVYGVLGVLLQNGIEWRTHSQGRECKPEQHGDSAFVFKERITENSFILDMGLDLEVT